MTMIVILPYSYDIHISAIILFVSALKVCPVHYSLYHTALVSGYSEHKHEDFVSVEPNIKRKEETLTGKAFFYYFFPAETKEKMNPIILSKGEVSFLKNILIKSLQRRKIEGQRDGDVRRKLILSNINRKVVLVVLGVMLE